MFAGGVPKVGGQCAPPLSQTSSYARPVDITRVGKVSVLRTIFRYLAAFQIGWPCDLFRPFSRLFDRKFFLLTLLKNMSMLTCPRHLFSKSLPLCVRFTLYGQSEAV